MNNRKKGLDVEREIIRFFSEELNLVRFPADNYQIGTSRALSKATDDSGVDIVFTSRSPSYLRDLNVQIKRRTIRTKKLSIDLEPLIRIEQMNKPLLISKIMVPRGKSLQTQGTYVTLKIEDYIELLRIVTGVQRLPSDKPVVNQESARTKRR